jgi:hypothetical protein
MQMQPLSRYGRLQCASSAASMAADTPGERPGAAVHRTTVGARRANGRGPARPWSRLGLELAPTHRLAMAFMSTVPYRTEESLPLRISPSGERGIEEHRGASGEGWQSARSRRLRKGLVLATRLLFVLEIEALPLPW